MLHTVQSRGLPDPVISIEGPKKLSLYLREHTIRTCQLAHYCTVLRRKLYIVLIPLVRSMLSASLPLSALPSLMLLAQHSSAVDVDVCTVDGFEILSRIWRTSHVLSSGKTSSSTCLILSFVIATAQQTSVKTGSRFELLIGSRMYQLNMLYL